MSFKINGLSGFQFRSYVSKSDQELEFLGVKRMVADCDDGFPCRVSLENARKGEIVYLVNYKHHAADSPYRASGPIFVRESATAANSAKDVVPAQLAKRLLSARGYDKKGFMKNADVVDGGECKTLLERFFQDPDIEYVHLHNARYGCFLAQVDRA